MLWTVPGGYNNYNLTIHGDQLLAITNLPVDIQNLIDAQDGVKDHRGASGFQSFGSFGIYELTLSGPVLRWERDDLGAPSDRPSGLFSTDGSQVGVRIGNEVYALDAATGDVLDFQLAWETGTPDESFQFSIGDVTFWVADSQHDGQNDHAVMTLGDTVTFSGRSFLNGMLQVHTYHTANQSPVVDGRMYVRGYDGMYCYDLRPSELVNPDRPVVSLSGDDSGSEIGPATIDIVVHRTAHLDSAVTVTLTLAGTANASDYTLSGATAIDSNTLEVHLAAGVEAGTVTITPIDDGLNEGTETLQFSFAEDDGYIINNPSNMTVDIIDAQTNTAPIITVVTPAGGSLEIPTHNDTPQLVITALDTHTPSNLLTYSWTMVSGPAAMTFTPNNAASTEVGFTTYGTYEARITVTDEEGLGSQQTIQLEVQDAFNTAPVASFTLSATAGQAPFTLQVDASDSSDADGDPISYAWDFGDGTMASGVNAQHRYDDAGTFTVTLTVTDDRSGSDIATHDIEVTTTPIIEGSIIWHENFNLVDGTVTDDGNTSWTLNNTGGQLAVHQGTLRGSNLDELVTWSSEAIDISGGLSHVTVDLRVVIPMDLEDSDLINVSYRLDGGDAVQVVEYVGQLSPVGEDWRTIAITDLIGTEIIIEVSMINSSTSEVYWLDNVIVYQESGPQATRTIEMHNPAGHVWEITPDAASSVDQETSTFQNLDPEVDYTLTVEPANNS